MTGLYYLIWDASIGVARLGDAVGTGGITGPTGPTGPTGATGPAASVHSGILAATTAANSFVSRLSSGLTLHDGTEASAKALFGGGMCVSGGATGATIDYYAAGGLAMVGTTMWMQDVPLLPNATGGMVPRGDSSLSGIFSRECGIYDGTYFATSFGPVEQF